MAYSKAWLQQAIATAKQLGFWDNVRHWEAELRKLES